MGSCFYENGLKFGCKGCGYCCSCEPGYVFLSKDDMNRMASGLGLDVKTFTDTYCRIVDMGLFKMVSLLEKENNDCIFLKDGKCRVYDCRPVQCSTYPFWAHVLESRETWDEETFDKEHEIELEAMPELRRSKLAKLKMWFCEGIGPEQIGEMVTAFREAVLNFIPNQYQREMMRRVLENQDALDKAKAEKAIKVCDARLKKAMEILDKAPEIPENPGQNP